MAQQYWVGELYVDLSRNQISLNNEHKTLAPKALSVLTFLAQNQGKVVSYDDILDQVWPNSIVTPNTLQRSIAQLRKCIAELGGTTDAITTHSKQGYSLELSVKWDNQSSAKVIDSAPMLTETHDLAETVAQPLSTKKGFSRRIWVMTLSITLIVVIALFNRPQPPQLKFEQVNQLTATDNKEYGASYTPDGKYVVFQRYFDSACINNLWAKTTDTHQEFQLTKDSGTYAYHNLSPNGETMIFVQEQDCAEPLTQVKCYQLMRIDFQQAMREPQIPSQILECNNSRIIKPTWIDNEHIVLMQNQQQGWQLVRYSMSNDISTTLYSPENATMSDFQFSAEHKAFAVIATEPNGERRLDMVALDGSLISSNLVQMPSSSPKFFKLLPNFLPNSDYLVFGDGGDIFTLSFDGKATPLNYQLSRNAFSPVFHPQGSKFLVISGQTDSDIAQVTLPDAPNENAFDVNADVINIIARSIDAEEEAAHQPNGDSIAFVSTRTGTEQIWLAEGENQRPLSSLATGRFIAKLIWSQDGNNILFLSNGELIKLSLDGTTHVMDFEPIIYSLFAWNSQTNKALANIRADGRSRFVEIDLNSGEYAFLGDKYVTWAAQNTNGDIFYTDSLQRFWKKTGLEDQVITALDQQGNDNGFIADNNRLVGINTKHQLWVFDLNSQSLSFPLSLPTTIERVSDIKDNKVLLKMNVAEKREVIEVSVSR